MQDDTTVRIARLYSIQPRLAKLLHVLIVEDLLTPTSAMAKGIDAKMHVYLLRKAMPTLTVQNQNRIGYWLPDALRLGMAVEVGVELSSSTLARMARERRIAEGVVEYLESPSEMLSSGTDVPRAEVQLPDVQCRGGEAA